MKFTNKTAFDLVGVSIDEYKNWCKKHVQVYYSSSVKKKFFDAIVSGKVKIASGKIVEDNWEEEKE